MVSLQSNASTTCSVGISGKEIHTYSSACIANTNLLTRYIADYVYALPTVAFFMTGLGIFIIGHFVSSQLLGYRNFRGPRIWRKSVATIRYLSYRGFYMESIRWHSAPIGVLLLGFAGTTYFLCKLGLVQCDQQYRVITLAQAWT